jgi:hypothetical protein
MRRNLITLMLAFLAGVSAAALVFAAFTFAQWTPNPAQWSEFARGVSALFMLCAFGFAFSGAIAARSERW